MQFSSCVPLFMTFFMSSTQAVIHDVVWASWHLISPAIRVFFNDLFRLKQQRKHQTLHYWIFVTGSLHKGPATRKAFPWWRHQMETFSALLAICAGNSPVSGEFPAQRPVTRSFDVFFDLRLNKRLSKQSWGWWFETLPRPLWRQCNALPWRLDHVDVG